MKKVNIYYFVMLTFFVISCGLKTEKFFFNSGEIKEERVYKKRNDTSSYAVINYYLNGQTKAKGNIIEGKKNGIWEEYYSDGSVKWVGEYRYGTRIIKLVSSKPIIVFEDFKLVKDKKTYLRIYLNGVHPEDMAIASNNGIIQVSDKKDMYDYMATPNKVGIIKFYIYQRKEGEIVTVGEDSFQVTE